MFDATPRKAEPSGSQAPTQQQSGSDQTLLSVKQARHRLNISHSTIFGLFRDDRLKSVRIGRKRMVRTSDLDAFVAGLGR